MKTKYRYPVVDFVPSVCAKCGGKPRRFVSESVTGVVRACACGEYRYGTISDVWMSHSQFYEPCQTSDWQEWEVAS